MVGELHPDGERIAFNGNLARPTDQSVYLLHIQDGEISPLVEDEGTLKQILVAEGDAVSEGQVVAILET